ncbi:LuxR family transcriptional regulator [Planotetraspora thailandica]|uniref:LuxR family transcriptional regulator n=1 Tax=Planotetraspora thailandica TaxID=487172 RepID=A0A8J3XYS6_9ACTN|nr:LuxR family transcriptional regulator [Planotetraspora thailandica]GII57845.1 LuxR family transcriptional regulator [Planotetraspora thailandica]
MRHLIEADMLLGREQESARLKGMLDAARRGFGGCLLLRGREGAGKTALLDHAVQAAPDAIVVRISGVESETGIGHAALHQVLLPFLDRLMVLPDPQRSALETVFGLSGGMTPEPFLVGVAALTLLADAAASSGGVLLCIVDDAHLVDQESAQVLAFAARRLRAERIVLLIAMEESPSGAATWAGLPVHEVGGLDPAAARELLLSTSSDCVADHVVERIVAEADGNPLALLEIGSTLTPDQLAGVARLPEPLPASDDARFTRELGRLPAAARVMLLTAAAEPSGDPEVVRRAGAELGFGDDVATLAGVRDVVELDGRIRFRHPLLRSAVYHGASTDERRRVHRVLAAVTSVERDPDRRTLHLAEAAPGPDEALAAELEAAAGRARARSGHGAEVAIRLRAADLTPDVSRRARRLVAAARAAVSAGAFTQARALLVAAAPHLSDPLTRALADEIQAKVELRLGGSAARQPALLLATARTYEDGDRRRRDKLLEAMSKAFVVRHAVERTTPLEVAEEALALPRPTVSDATAGDLLLHGCATLVAVGYTKAVPLLRAALGALADPEVFAAGAPEWFMLGATAAQAVWDDGFRAGWFRRVEEQARADGAHERLRWALMAAQLERASSGRIADAGGSLESAGAGPETWEIITTPEVPAWQGRDEETLSAAARFERMAGDFGMGVLANLGQVALGVLALGRGRYRDAFEATRRLCEQDVLNLEHLALPDLIEAGVRCGERDHAAEALGRLRVKAVAAATPWALGLLARSEALLAEPARAEDLYVQAVEHLERTRMATDLARAHLVYGEWLRRNKRKNDARLRLRLAHDMFIEMGAAAFAERCRMELVAAGDREGGTAVREPGDLTPQERRIARLAAGRATNQEIAAQLFISPSTVDYHLKKVFRKLGVRSRRQLVLREL